MSQYLYEFVGVATKETLSEGELGKYMLSLRYSQRLNIPRILTFSVLALSCGHLNYHVQLNPHTVQRIYRQLLLEADFFFNLLTYSQLLPLVLWVQNKTVQQIQQTLGSSFRQLTRQIPQSQLKKTVGKQKGYKCLQDHLKVIKLLDSKNVFAFYFSLMNGAKDSLENDIDCFFLELANIDLQEGLISTSELAQMQKNIELQYAKLRKRKYQEDIIETIYRWLQGEIQTMLVEVDSPINLIIEKFTQIIQTQSNICGATLLQVLDASVEMIQPQTTSFFLQVINVCLTEGSHKISTQAILFLISTIFIKIHAKKLSIGGEVMMDHLLLWQEVANRRQLPSRLLGCLIEWLPFIYQNPLPTHSQIEILQLYRKQFLKLRKPTLQSQISGLKVLVEQLQNRKIQSIYVQLEQFHSQMDRPPHYPSRRSACSNGMHFQISQLNKSHSQINSMLNSFENISKTIIQKSKNGQLQLLSKRHSKNVRFEGNQNQSYGQCVQIILSLIDLFDYHITPSNSLSSYHITQQVSSISQSLPNNSNLMPIVSTHQQLTKISVGESVKEIIINAGVLSQDFKKKMVKRRGLIVKKESIEIGYMVDSQSAKYTIFLTFLKPISTCAISIKENSFKLKGQKQWLFTRPSINHQYQICCSIGNVKLYSFEKVPNSEKTVRSNIQFSLMEGRLAEEEKHELPLSIFNLIDCQLPILQDTPPFLQRPSLETKWFPVCAKLSTNNSEYLKRFMPFHRDSKGNYLLKCQLFGQAWLIRILLVLNQAKLELFGNGDLGKLVAMGLMQIMS